MKQLRKRKILIVLISVLVLSLIAGAVTLLILHRREQVLEQQQDAALQELYDNRGKYDEQSIVLTNTTKSRAEALAEAFGATLRITEDGSFATLTLPEGVSVFDIYEDEANRKHIEHLSLDYHASVQDLGISEEMGGLRLPMRPQSAPADTGYAQQTYLDYLNMQNVWGRTQGAGVTVAVIDTGIDTDHSEFAGRISEFSYNATEDKIVKDWLQEDGSYDWSLIEDEQGHGTAVAGVIAASVDGDGVVGIAPKVNLIVIKAECNENGTFKRTSDLVFALYYAIERDVSVVNMSFGTIGNNPFAEPARLAVDSDILCLAAAGNESSAAPTYPAADENVFGIGSLADNSWALADYSNYGENVDFVAPGTVYTTLMGGGYGYMNGTSFACPVSAGVMALYASQNRYADFKTTAELLYASCYDLGDLGPDRYYGYGALDVSALLLEKRGTVTFNMMTDELENTAQVFIRNHTLQNIPQPERLYAIFDGWYYDPQCTEEYVWYEDKFHTDLTLYANWVNEEDGIPYTYVELDDGTIEIRSYTGHRRYITIPDYIDGKLVSSIGEYAFAGNTRIREVTLPKYLKRIRTSAFSECANLVSIGIPDTVTEIEAYAFSGDVRLSGVILGKESQLVSIGNFAFAGCAKMRDFTVPAKVTVLSGSVFNGSTSLMSIEVDERNESFCAENGVLFTKNREKLICHPAGLNGSYTLPQSVREIDDYAFAYTHLSGVELSKAEVIGSFAFAYGQLKSVVLPHTVIRLGTSAFEGCSYMTSAVLSQSLTEIPAKAFSLTSLTSVDIPPSIARIESQAFYKIYTLTKVNFASDGHLTSIGAAAFFEDSVTSLSIPASVEFIDDSAFASIIALTSLTFEEGSGLNIISNNAFKDTISLTSVSLPEGLITLGENAFMNSGLLTVTIPASLQEMKAGAFASCHSLTSIFVDSQNSVYADVGGVVYLKDGSALVAYPAGNNRTEYTVENGVTEILAAAFQGAENLHYAHLPEGLLHVREYAFANTKSMERMVLPDSVEVLDEYSFAGCGAKAYDLSDNLREIKMYALSQNLRLTSIEIPDSVMQISNYTFAEDWNLRSVTFTENAKIPRISYGAFAYCGLTSFRVPASVSTMAQGAFMECTNLQSVTFAKDSQLTSISAYMFDGCSNLQSITFEEGSALTSIQAHGLEGLTKLTTLDLGDAKLQNIDNFAFRFCESLTRFDVPEGVTFLGRYAFYYCTKLAEVTIPATVDFIGRFAFLGTKDLNVYFAAETLPENLAEDWDHGTAGYYLGVTDVVTEGDWTYALLTDGGIAIIKYNGTAADIDLATLNLGGDIVNIGGEAFAYSTVEHITLPDTLVTIQAEAFYHSALKAVSIPANVTFIGRSAFADTPIESLTFVADAQVKTIEQSAFEHTEKLGGVVIPSSVTTLGRALFKNSGITSLTFADGFAMTEIPEEAFAYTHISSVIIPDSVTLINHNAFREIKELKSVTFGRGEELMIMSNAFYQSGLETVDIPENVSYVGEYAFVALPNLSAFTVSENNPYYKAVDGLLVSKNGHKLISVPAGRTGSLTVPEGIEVIGFGAFEDSKLSEIKFLENANILSFGYRAFYNADGITEMHIPASVIAIDYYAFAMCDNLQKVTFAESNNLKGVYEGAFYGCKNLSDIMLPDSIVEISDFAFYGCRRLTDIPVSETCEIKGIYDYAFAYAGFGGDYTTPETLIDIGAHAFMGNKFTSVTIPGTNYWDLVIGLGAFEQCNEITEITMPFIGASFEDDQFAWFGYIFGAGSHESNATYVPENLKKVSITRDITVLHAYTFYGLSALEEVSLPTSIRTIGHKVFEKTTFRYELSGTIEFLDLNGKPVTLASKALTGTGVSGSFKLSNKVQNLAVSAFENCKYLEGIELPASITSIPHRAFFGCESLVYVGIPDTVTSIDFGSFGDCKSLKEIFIPDGITKIGDSAFRGCESLEHIDIPDTISEFGSNALTNCSSLKELRVPPSVTAINLSNCSSLETVDLPEGITSVNFRACTKLKEIHLPSTVTSLPQSAFFGCESLKEIVLPEGMSSIERHTFRGCINLTSVVIPDSVTSIFDYAFSNCINLGEITLGSGLQNIYTGAFDNCTILYRINNRSNIQLSIGENYSNGKIAQYVKVIIDKDGNKTYRKGSEGFTFVDTPDGFRFIYEGGKYKLISYFGEAETVTLPMSINDQPYEVFNMRGVKRVIIPEGITSLASQAFRDCVSLEYIELPDSMTELGSYAFYGCTNLQEVKLPKELRRIPAYAFASCSALNDIQLPDTLERIDEYAFNFCSSLKSVPFPPSLTTIGDVAFEGCSSLTSITIPESTVNIGIYVFNLCFGLTEVNLPDTMTVLPESFLKSCTSLRTIHLPESLTEIGRYALASTGLVSIELPHGITHIPDSLFNSCKSLQSVTIPSSVTSIGQDAFYYCLGLESLTLPEGVTTLESFAFQHCHELKELVIPSSLTHIGRAAFIYCYELSSLSLPQGLQSIDKEAFSNCGATVTIHPDNPYFVAKDGIIYNKDMTQILYVSDHVTEAIIPAGVKDIQSAFSYHTQLKKISFEAGSAITQIPSGAFYGCSELSEIILPAGVKTIGNSAFYECKSLRYIEIPEGVTLIDAYAFAYSSNLETVIFPDSVTSISSYAFYECTGLVFMNLPKDLKSIGDSAFSRCFALPRLDLPEGLTSIGYSAFSACRNLTTVVLPQSLTSLGTYAFGSCESLYQIINRSDITLTLGSTNSDDITYYTKILTDKQGNVSYATDSSGGAYIVVDNFLYICRNDTYTMLAYLGNEASVTLPTDVNGHAYTIQKLRGVTRLTLPEGVTEIPSSAFGDCYSLVEINLPESLLSIGHGAFYGCENLRTVTIPDRVHLVDTSAFAYCTKLSSVTLSESLTAIGDAVFSNCSSLAQIDIPDGVTNIGSSAFANCSSLRSITIPDNVTNLGSSAFANCSALETIVLGDNITSIGADVFTETAYAQNPENWENGCLYIGNYLFDVDEQLTAYILPEGVKVIAEDAFENCHLIKTVSIGGNHPKLLADLTNVETLVITEMPTGYVYSYFGRFPSTLRNVVLEKDVKISARSLLNLTNATIYVADSEKDTQWDENFPGWHQGNAVVYGDKWINVVFHDENGVILSSQIFKTSAIIRQPYMGDRTDDIYRYIFMGYDMNGDGSPDTIPATSTADLHAYAVYAREYRCVKEGHLYGDQIVINAPTCTTDGLACQDCVYCGHRKNTAIDALGHVYESQVTLPTCTEQGYTTHSCTRCQETYRDTVTAPLGHKAGSAATCTDAQTCTVCGTILTAALGHEYDQAVIHPTCTEQGYTKNTCLRCGDVYCDAWTLPLGHKTDSPATCTEAQLCTVCGTVVTPALGHSFSSVVTPPTCTELGYTTYTCYRCEESYTDTWRAPTGHSEGPEADCVSDQICLVCGITLVKAYGHDYIPTVTPPTCTAQGYTTFNCSRCDENYRDVWTDPVPHTPGADATCTEDQLCTVCGTVTTPALGHSYAPVVTPPTCTEQGYTTYVCTRCDNSYKTSWTQATGHQKGQEANCTEDQICTACGITLVMAYGHDYIPTVTPPTCTAQGYTTFSCNRCDESYRDVWTDPVPHTPGADATCTEDQLCSVCGTVTTPALGHSYDPVVTPPTCTEQGYTTYVCTRCDNSYKTLWTQATGHSKGPEANCTDNQICTVCGILLVKAYGHDYLPTVTEPTCTAQGYTTFSCSQCHESYRDVWTDPVPHTPGADATCTEDQLCTVCGTVVTPAMGHSYDSVVTPPTCTEEGFTTYTCASCQDSFVAEHTPITEHSYHSVVTPPSCTEEGYTTHTCTVCGFIIRDDITSPSGHVPGEEPTCTEHQYCITCGKILTQKLWHDYDTTVIPASCLGQGHTIYNCRRCGHSYVSNYTPVGDHVAGAAPTCTEDQVCTVCNSTLADKLGHDNTSVVTDPTCTEEGYTTHTCNRCGFVCTDTYVEPLGHTEGNRADCLNDQTCTACGVILAERLGHDYSLTVFEPSCTEEGYTEYRCNRCGDQYQDDFIKPLGHAKGAEPDCENDQICTTCGIVLTERFGHDYESSTTPPTCTEAGSVICTCTRCGDSYLDGEPAPLGHSSSCWIVDLEPAPGIEGQKHLECTVCGEILESAIIEALPLETESETDLEIDLETNGLTDPDIEPETKPNHETDGEISSGTEYETQPDIFPETEGESKQPVETETVGESQNGAITEKAPAGGGCSGNIFSSISLLMLAFPALFMALKRKKETE